MPQIKKIELPSRHTGRSYTSGKKGKSYIFFADDHLLYSVDFRTRTVWDITNSPDAKATIAKMSSYQSVPQWAYALLRNITAKVVEYPSNLTYAMVDEIEMAEVASITTIPVKPAPFDLSQSMVFWKRTNGRTVVLVLGEDKNPKTSKVFHINSDGKASICLNGSKGQQYTTEQLIEKGWLEDKLENFPSIRKLLESEQAESEAKAA